MSNLDKAILLHAHMNLAKVTDKLLSNGAVLIDGQTRILANAEADPNIPKPDSEHPYDKMAEDTKKRFQHCHEEIDEFFKVEKLRNEQENELRQNGDSTSYANARSLQWAYFWEGIKKLEIERHNVEVKVKKIEKKKKKGRKHGTRKRFDGPTFTT